MSTSRPVTCRSRVIAVALAVCLACTAGVSAAGERVWQSGVWREVRVTRPKVIFGITPGPPTATGVGRAPTAPREIRTYIIETDAMRLELKDVTTMDAPRLEVLVGDPVTFAVEKKVVYVKDQDGREHRLALTKETRLVR